MSPRSRFGASALIITGALAIPAGANAADIQTAVSAVKANTERADAGLDRAVKLFAAGNDRAARVAFAKSRKNMGQARAAAARARRDAETPKEQADAAFAQALLALEQGENIEKLADALTDAAGADASKIASAARADTQGRDKAIAVLGALLGEVPDQAKAAIAGAIAALSVDRADEAKVEGAALASSRVSEANKRRVAAAVKSSMDGQNRAAATIAALIADPDMPSESKEGLQRAYEAVIADHTAVGTVLSRFSDRLPAFVRSFVERIVTQARSEAQTMRENRPAGPPAGVPGGPPSA